MAVFIPAIWSWNLTGRGKGVKVCRCPSLWLRVRGIDPRDGYENTDPHFFGIQGHFLPRLSLCLAPHLLLLISILPGSTYSRTCQHTLTFCSCRDILPGILRPASTVQTESPVHFSVQPEAWPLLPGLQDDLSTVRQCAHISCPLWLQVAARGYPGSSGPSRDSRSVHWIALPVPFHNSALSWGPVNSPQIQMALTPAPNTLLVQVSCFGLQSSHQ